MTLNCIFEINSLRVSFKCWVLRDAFRHLSIYVMVLPITIVQFASVAWKFLALDDSFVLETFQTNIPVVWDVKPCILLYVPTFWKSFQPSTSSVLDYSKGSVGLLLRSIVFCTPIYTATYTRRLRSSSVAL